MAAVRTDQGQGEVGVEVRIAMARKVLGTCHDACGPKALCPSESARSDRTGVGPEGPVANYGIVWVAVHVHDGGKIHVNANVPQFVARHAARMANEVHILDGAQGHGFGEPNAIGEAHAGAPFRIHCGEQADSGSGHGGTVQPRQIAGRGGDVALHGNHPADAERLHHFHHVCRALRFSRTGVHGHHHQLRNPRFHAEAVEQGLCRGGIP